jgi:hypothetical protein
VAHFEFFDYGDQCIFLRQIRAFKAGDRLFCYYGADYEFAGEQYIKLDPPPAAIAEEEGDNKRKRKGKAKDTIVGGQSGKKKAKGGGRGKGKGKKGKGRKGGCGAWVTEQGAARNAKSGEAGVKGPGSLMASGIVGHL